MYKSIVFDLGGVMIDFDPRGYLVDRLCNAETEEEVYDLTFGSEEWKLLDASVSHFFFSLSEMNWSPETTLPVNTPISGFTFSQHSFARAIIFSSALKESVSTLGICPGS